MSDKILLIKNMLDKVDKLIIGGGMAYTFLKVTKGMAIGTSLYDEEGAKIVPEIMEKAKEKGVELILPCDFVTSSKFGEDGEIGAADESTGIPEGMMGLDCGPKSMELNKVAIDASKTIIWNGPMVRAATTRHRRVVIQEWLKRHLFLRSAASRLAVPRPAISHPAALRPAASRPATSRPAALRPAALPPTAGLRYPSTGLMRPVQSSLSL